MTESPHDILDRLSADIETLRGFFPPPIPPDPDAIFKPRSFEKVEEAIEYWGLPTDMEYVPWDPETDTDIGQALDRIGINRVLVLAERDDPYPLDSRDGFAAYGVSAITGPNGTRTNVVNKPARWFEMARGNILGLGPGAVIEPTDSGWSAPAQPKPLYYFDKKGKQVGELVGNQNVLIGSYSKTGIFCNFTLRGRDFGEVVYDGLKFVGCELGICKGIHFDQASRGRHGIPNLESGSAVFYKGRYEIQSLLIDNHPKWSSSPIMWNRNNGGTLKDVKIANYAPHGMPTMWACEGYNQFENFNVQAWYTGLNVEQSEPGCEIDWTGGSITLNQRGSWHLNIGQTKASTKIRLRDVEITPNGVIPGKLVCSGYRTPGIQRMSDIECDTLPIEFIHKDVWA